MRAYVAFGVLILTGCALEPLTEAEQAEFEYRRDSARVEAIERFERLKRTCRAARGRLQVSKASGRIGRLTTEEMDLATCVRHASPAIL